MKKLAAFALILLLALPAFAAGRNDGTHYILVTSGLPNENNVSGSMWLYIVGYGAGNVYIFNARGVGDTVNPSYYYTSAGVLTSHVTGEGSTVTGSTLSTATWYFLAWRRSGTNYQMYLNGSTTADITETATETAGAINGLALGAFDTANNRCSCRIAAFKYWNAYLTPEQLSNERRGYRPRTTAGLYSWSPMFFAVNPFVDFSGLANNLPNTLAATEDGPPIGW